MGDTVIAGVSEPLLEQRVWKIIVVGDMNTGKTSIIQRYCDKHFIEYYRPTTGESNVLVHSNSGELKKFMYTYSTGSCSRPLNFDEEVYLIDNCLKI